MSSTSMAFGRSWSIGAAVTARQLGRPYIMTPHGMLDPWSLSQRRLKKQLYLAWRLRKDLQRAAAIHFITEGERDLTRSLSLKAPSLVVPIGLDWSEFDPAPARGTFRSQYPAIGDRPMLLFLGRIHFKKGLDYLISAMERMANKRAVLVIVGPDSDGYRVEVERQIQSAGLGDRVIFTGILHGPARIAAMADADLFVLPSRQENFGVAVAEALAAGTPVVVSDRVNLHPEVSGAGVGAVTTLDAGHLAATLDAWLADEGLRQAASARAGPFVRARFDWPRIAREWGSHYANLMASRGEGRTQTPKVN